MLLHLQRAFSQPGAGAALRSHLLRAHPRWYSSHGDGGDSLAARLWQMCGRPSTGRQLPALRQLRARPGSLDCSACSMRGRSDTQAGAAVARQAEAHSSNELVPSAPELRYREVARLPEPAARTRPAPQAGQQGQPAAGRRCLRCR